MVERFIEEGSSATDSVRDVTDVTDVSPIEVGRRKKEEALIAMVSAIKNVLTVLAVAISLKISLVLLTACNYFFAVYTGLSST
jgi:hypothetical protein